MSLCECGKPVTCFVGYYGHINRRCDECANKMIACPHEEGTRSQSFDADGCGFYLWTCDDCGYVEVDDAP